MSSRLIKACGLATALTVFAIPVHADIQQKAGLWEHTAKVKMDGLPEIDPLMLAQMEAAGIEVPFAKPVTTQICLTPEQVAQKTLPDMSDANSGCSSKNVRREGDQIVGDLECNGQVLGRGTVRIDLESPESFSGVQTFKGTSQGVPVAMTTNMSGRWIGPECGNVRPLGQ